MRLAFEIFTTPRSEPYCARCGPTVKGKKSGCRAIWTVGKPVAVAVSRARSGDLPLLAGSRSALSRVRLSRSTSDAFASGRAGGASIIWLRGGWGMPVTGPAGTRQACQSNTDQHHLGSWFVADPSCVWCFTWDFVPVGRASLPPWQMSCSCCCGMNGGHFGFGTAPTAGAGSMPTALLRLPRWLSGSANGSSAV